MLMKNQYKELLPRTARKVRNMVARVAQADVLIASELWAEGSPAGGATLTALLTQDANPRCACDLCAEKAPTAPTPSKESTCTSPSSGDRKVADGKQGNTKNQKNAHGSKLPEINSLQKSDRGEKTRT